MGAPTFNPSAPASEEGRETGPTLVLVDPQRDFLPHPASWVNSVLVHLFILGGLLVLNLADGFMKSHSDVISREVVNLIHLPWPGGGGGDKSPTPASRGALPPFSRTQLAPPRVRLLVPEPQIPVAASILGPPELTLPEMKSDMNWGDASGVDGPLSGGPGTGDGIGTGNDNGVGPGRGPGYGPNTDGGAVYPVGRGVTAPVPTFKPEPPYSEEARRAKHQGTVSLMIVVGPDGNVTHAQVVRSLGLGLDEKAQETVLTWQFRPGMRNGVPVAVRVLVEVSFRLF